MPQRTRECMNSNVLILTYIPGGKLTISNQTRKENKTSYMYYGESLDCA